ncbi:MAG TPA: tRNA (N6-threonylcarbamoyladenosine(37)-N6)-methyltransferase TrmO [Aminobacterium sp.]|uniref:tRNA (N6-threonylcarbamoyladenosine(37)-N6)-methyltransferase TrmO n=1 Tax=Aminobacterium TaxID=81466 RepID=UPI0004632A8C|nr:MULTISPECIES: tRNA (N6-threonylcarbamoyladenosine(37)-N6)-methyltransferase TrmO [Aminobacterium]HCA40215.1 tRNA (N6-threonylcarbamoyladenosine(37)-N6)-methyltransferase TrmO [Aminobacterium sp.]
MKGCTFYPIGVVHSPVKDPVHPDLLKDVEAKIEIKPFYELGLDDLREGQEIIIVFRFHRSSSFHFHVHPKGDLARPLKGVFATCSPRRPNFLGVSRCVLKRKEGCCLHVSGLDAIDGTPVLDIKPFALYGGRG